MDETKVQVKSKPNKMQSFSNHDIWCYVGLKYAAENLIQSSLLLQATPESSDSEKNPCPCHTLQKGYLVLDRAQMLVSLQGTIHDENIEQINAALIELEFDSDHRSLQYTSRADIGEIICCNSNGRNTKYYKLLHSELQRDVREFVEMVKHKVDAPAKRFLESIKRKFPPDSFQKLLKAVKNNNLDEVKFLIGSGAFINSRDTYGRTPLHYAVYNGNIDIVKLLIERRADITQVTNKGTNPLHTAATKGNKEIVEVLLQYVKRPKLKLLINDKTTVGGYTPLHISAENSFFDVVKTLLKYGATYCVQNKEGKTPLDLSNDKNVINVLKLTEQLFEDAKNGNGDIFDKLRSMKLDELVAVTGTCNNQGNTLLQVALTNHHKNIASNIAKVVKEKSKVQQRPSHDRMVDQVKNELTLSDYAQLIDAAHDYVTFSDYHLSLLLQATMESWVSENNPCPCQIFKKGWYVLNRACDLVEKYKEYSLHGAIDDKNIELINVTLMELEFNPDHNGFEYTHGAYSGEGTCFFYNGQNTRCYKLLHSELKKDLREFVKMAKHNIVAPAERFLKSAKMKLESISFQNLLKAVKNNSLTEVNNVGYRWAFMNSKDTYGRTPLHYAVNNGDIDIVKSLIEREADVTQVTDKGSNPLHTAATKGNKDIVEILLQHINRHNLNHLINAKTTVSGITPLHIAAEKGFLDIVKSLLKYSANYCIQNKYGKTPLNFSKDQNISNLLKLTEELFEDAKNGNGQILGKLTSMTLDDFVIATSTCNNQDHTLLDVAIINDHGNLGSDIAGIIRANNEIRPSPSRDRKIFQLESLKYAAKIHIDFSKIYLPMLRNMSHPTEREINVVPWKTLKEGSYFLDNAYSLVEKYKNFIPGAIHDQNIQIINATLKKLQFHPNHISEGYTDEAYGGVTKCFVSKGQGTLYYGLLHSEFKKDVRFFIEMVERDIDAPVARYLESIKHLLQ